MTEDGGPDVVIKQSTPVPDNPAMNEVTRFDLRFSRAFWHKLYAGLAMQRCLRTSCCTMSDIAMLAHDVADAMLAHEAKSKEDDGETDDKCG